MTLSLQTTDRCQTKTLLNCIITVHIGLQAVKPL